MTVVGRRRSMFGLFKSKQGKGRPLVPVGEVTLRKELTLMSVFAAIAILSGCSPEASTGEDKQPATIAGFVLDSSNGQVVSGAKVSTDHSSSRSGDDGVYRVTTMQAGLIDVTAERYGFTPFRGQVEVSGGEEAPLDITISPQNVKPLKLLFVGNSITFSSPNPNIGWCGNWGMAASSAENDYAHLLAAKLVEYGMDLSLETRNVAAWEAKFQDFDLSKLQFLRDYDADIILVRLGDNVSEEAAVTGDLGEHLKELIKFIDGERPSKVVVTDSFFTYPRTNQELREAAQESGYFFCSITDLFRVENLALSEYEDKGVGMHPSDKGMGEIAKRLFACLESSGFFESF